MRRQRVVVFSPHGEPIIAAAVAVIVVAVAAAGAGRLEVGVEIVDGTAAVHGEAEVAQVDPLQVAQAPVLWKHGASDGADAAVATATATAAVGSGRRRGKLMSWSRA